MGIQILRLIEELFFPIRKISFLCSIHIKQICKVVEKLFFRQQPIVAWIIAAVIVTRKSKGSIAVVIQTVPLATFQIASTIHVSVTISLPFSTLMGACAASWSSTSISASCKNKNGNEFHSLISMTNILCLHKW